MTILERSLVTISLQNYDSRKDELITQLITAAEESGFFAPTDHGITEQEISDMFATSHQFFSLPEEVKTKYYFERMKVGTPPIFPPEILVASSLVLHGANMVECRMGM
jgi:isopenicillin N synthase-like dioxygenase